MNAREGDPTGLPSRAPGNFKIYGLKNYSDTWEVLHDQTATKAYYADNMIARITISPRSTQYYQYIGLVVGKLAAATGDSFVMQFAEWKLFGNPLVRLYVCMSCLHPDDFNG
jgi:hypothetical protein